MIYFIKLKEFDFVKIGYTKNKDPRARLSGIETCCPFAIKLLLFIEGNLPFEKHLHNLFISSWYNKEWFKYSSEIEQYIEKHLYLNIPTVVKQHNKRKSYKIISDSNRSKLEENVKNDYISGVTCKDIMDKYTLKWKQVRYIVDKYKLRRPNYKKPIRKLSTVTNTIDNFARTQRKKAWNKYLNKEITATELKEIYTIYPPKTWRKEIKKVISSV